MITIVTLGNGATSAVKTSIRALGSDILQVRPGQSTGPGGGGSGEVAPSFKLTDLDAIREQIAGVTRVAGQAQVTGTVIRNAQNWSTTITGTSNDYFEVQKWAMTHGRQFTAQEEQAGKSVCVIGATIVKNLFQAVDPIGQSFRVKGISCAVVGVLAARGQGNFGNDQDDVVSKNGASNCCG